MSAIRETVIVRADGVIEVQSPELREGDRAEVIVLLEVDATTPPKPAVPPQPTSGEFIASAAGTFKTAADVAAYVRELRDEWDR